MRRLFEQFFCYGCILAVLFLEWSSWGGLKELPSHLELIKKDDGIEAQKESIRLQTQVSTDQKSLDLQRRSLKMGGTSPLPSFSPSSRPSELSRQECDKKMTTFLEKKAESKTSKQSSEAKRWIIKNLLNENRKAKKILASSSQKLSGEPTSYLCPENIQVSDLILLRNAIAIRDLATNLGWLGAFYQKNIKARREARACATQILESYPVHQHTLLAEKSYFRIKVEVLRRLKAQGFNVENLEVSDSLEEMIKKMGSLADLNDDSEEGRGEDVVLLGQGAVLGGVDESILDISSRFSSDGCTSREWVSDLEAAEDVLQELNGIGAVQSRRRSVNNREEVFRAPDDTRTVHGNSRRKGNDETHGWRAR